MKQPEKPRVLLFSQRNIFGNELFRCTHFEFENIISQLDSAEILAPTADPSKDRHHRARRVAFHFPIALNPGIQKTKPEKEYDLFVAICGAPGDLLMVNALNSWKNACKKSICLIDEIWVKEMPDYRHFLNLLKGFDVVMLYYSQSVEPLNKLIGTKCVFLPPGVDALRFCPYPNPPRRSIDVYSIGRRSQSTHEKLLRMVEEDRIFYLYDTIAGSKAINSLEHRSLFINMAKRTRYFIVNPGLIDRPEKRGNQIESGYRYFEGSAAGTILVGEQPKNEAFDTLFNWPDSVIQFPYNSTEIDKVIADLDRQPERQEKIRRTNVGQALMRHDWVYRWEAMLTVADLEPMPQVSKRKQHLKELADSVLGQPVGMTI